MSLRARFVLLCAFFAAVVTAAALFGSHLVLRANDERRSQSDLATAVRLAQDLEATYVGEAASIRSYFLSGDQAALDDYNARRASALSTTGRLLGLVMDDPTLVRRVNAATDAARLWRNDAILPLITLQQQIGQSQQVVTSYRDGPAVPAFQRIAANLDTMRDEISDAEAAAARRAERTRTDVARFVVGSVISAVGFLILLLLIGRLWIVRPLNQIGRALRHEPNDLPMRKRGPREIVQLARDAEALRDRARTEIELASRTREGLTQNAELLMSIRGQLETSPENLPSDWTVAAQLKPATGIVAGDCYNIDVLGREYLTIVVVDVAGHGAGSAVIALRANELLRAAVRSYEDPGDAVTWASAQLSDLDPEMFVTAFVGKLEFATGLLRYVNAGHPAALVCDGVNAADLPPTGPLIGPFAGKWKSREAIVGPGQLLVCYTDGLVEVRDTKREEFGMDRLRKALRESYEDGPEEMIKHCLTQIDLFGDGRAHDDVTLTIVGRQLDA